VFKFARMPHHIERTTPLVALLLFFSCLCKAEYSVKCSNSTQSSTTMVPSEDGVRGRYIVEWCTNVKTNDTKWKLELAYNRINPKACYNRNRHSTNTENISNINLNCTHVSIF
jgi:hypothetical protein